MNDGAQLSLFAFEVLFPATAAAIYEADVNDGEDFTDVWGLHEADFPEDV